MTAKKLKGPDARFKVDPKIAEEGITIDYGDFQFLITRAGPTNKKLEKATEEALRPHRRAIANDVFDEELERQLIFTLWAKHVILGWSSPLGKNLIPYEGKPLEFTTENCVKLFIELPDLFVDLKRQAMNLSLFVADSAETDAGN